MAAKDYGSITLRGSDAKKFFGSKPGTKFSMEIAGIIEREELAPDYDQPMAVGIRPRPTTPTVSLLIKSIGEIELGDSGEQEEQAEDMKERKPRQVYGFYK